MAERLVRYQIAVTYRCNLACSHCYQMLDRFPCNDVDSDITEKDIIASGKILAAHGIRPSKLRFTGGEPLLHPKVRELYALTKEHWNPHGCFRIYSSGVSGNPLVTNMAFKSPKKKRVFHSPLLISPADVGVPVTQGIETPCHFSKSCGRGFDAYGFTPCCRAWSLGRLFGIDAHRRNPVLIGWEQLCEHCVYGVSVADFLRLTRDAREGEIEYPSPTYRDAIDKRREQGFPQIKKFLARVEGE